jgi:trehalose 6-phosphate synthase
MLLDAARLRKRGDLDRVTALYERPTGPTGDNVVSMFERKQAVGFR